MFTWSINGDGYGKIAQRLNSLGIPTRRQGKVTKTGKVIGKGWTATYIQKLLTETAAYGESKIQVKGGDTFTFPLPPIVERQTFDLAQRAIKSRRHFGHRITNRKYLISPRRGKCAECGLRFRLQSRSYRVRRKNGNGELKVYERKMMSPVLICRGMHNYPHMYQCRQSKYIDFDKVQTAILRRVCEALSTDDFAWASIMPDDAELKRAAMRLNDAKQSLEQTQHEISFVVTEGRTGSIPKSVYDLQMSQLNETLEYKQEQARKLEEEYGSISDRGRKLQKAMPLISLLKTFWSTFKEATVSSNRGNEGEDRLEDLPINRESMDKLREMIDIFVEGFNVDRDNNISVQLSIPILEGIEADAKRCRQLPISPSP
jgi:hypothetical protein